MTNKSFPVQVGDDLFSLETLLGRSYVYGYPKILKAFANLKQFNRDDLNIVIEREIYPSYGAIKVPVQGEWLPRAMLRLEPVIDGQVNTTGYLVAECIQYSNTEFIGEIVAVQNLVTPHNKWRVRRASGSPPRNTTQTFLPVYPKYGPSNYTIYISPGQPPMHQRRHLAMGGNRDGFWPNIDRGNQSTYPRVFRNLSSVSVPCGAYYEASTNHPFTLPELENLCGAIPSFYLEVSPLPVLGFDRDCDSDVERPDDDMGTRQATVGGETMRVRRGTSPPTAGNP